MKQLLDAPQMTVLLHISHLTTTTNWIENIPIWISKLRLRKAKWHSKLSKTYVAESLFESGSSCVAPDDYVIGLKDQCQRNLGRGSITPWLELGSVSLLCIYNVVGSFCFLYEHGMTYISSTQLRELPKCFLIWWCLLSKVSIAWDYNWDLILIFLCLALWPP